MVTLNFPSCVLTRCCLLQTKLTHGGVRTRWLSIYNFSPSGGSVGYSTVLGSDSSERGPWNISVYITPKNPLQQVHSSPTLGVLRHLSMRIQCLAISLGPLKYYRESTTADQIQCIDNRKSVPSSWDYTQVFGDPSVAPQVFRPKSF